MSEPRRLLALRYEYVEDMAERRSPHRDAHPAHVRAWEERGRLVIAGALGAPPHGAFLAFDVRDEAELEEFVRADPYVRAGLVSEHRVEPWTVVTAAA